MPQDWDDVERFTVETATTDLEERSEVRPALFAFAGDQPCFLAFLRWFPKGAYHEPLLELLALGVGLAADRLAFSTGGRLTSLADPIPPVTDEVDLRQRALVVEYVDGHDGPLRRHSLIHPFTLAGGTVAWDDPVRLTDGQGWIAQALQAAVQRRGQLGAHGTAAALRAQALRCAELGHDLYLDAGVSARLGLQGAAQ